jgi:hypothetical protein
VLHLRTDLLFVHVVFVIALKRESFDGVPKVVVLPGRVAKVWDKVMDLHGIGLEGPAGGKVDVADNLVDAHTPGDTASLGSLAFDLIGPALGHALRDVKSILYDSATEIGRRTWSMESGLPKLHPRLTYAWRTSSQVLQQPLAGSVPP